MKNYLKKLGIVGVLAVVVFLAFSLMSKPDTQKPNNVLALQPPPFVNTVLAAPNAQTGTSFLEDEAGISAYFTTTNTINLDTVRPLYRVIEVETSDYILGSIPVANYSETQEVHAYIHKNGWVLVYYGNKNPVSKIVDLKDYDSSGGAAITTKLENTLAIIAGTIGEPFPGATYYDFRYPNATNMMIIVEKDGTFYVTLPSSYGFYERSWSLGGRYASYKHYYLDGNEIDYVWEDWERYGTFTAAQLLPDQSHSIKIDTGGYGSLVLVYRVP